MERLAGIGGALVGALVMATVMTLGDFIWYAADLRHRMTFGLIHGAVVCMVLGVLIGIFAEGGGPAVARGLFGAIVVGLLAAGSFYVAAPVMGYGAMFLSWMLLWLLMALLNRHIRGTTSPFVDAEPVGTATLRGIVAAALSGVAFWSISGIWTGFHAAAPNYAWNFVAWTIAFFPGLLPLLIERQR